MAAVTVRIHLDSGHVAWADMPSEDAARLLADLSRADPFALVPIPGTSRRVAPAHIALWEVGDAPSLGAFGGFGETLRPTGYSFSCDSCDGTFSGEDLR